MLFTIKNAENEHFNLHMQCHYFSFIIICYLNWNLHTLDDQLDYHNNMQFSTKDVDNDAYSGNCGQSYGGVGNWYKACQSQKLNGPYGTSNFRWSENLQKSRWMLREIV